MNLTPQASEIFSELEQARIADVTRTITPADRKVCPPSHVLLHDDGSIELSWRFGEVKASMFVQGNTATYVYDGKLHEHFETPAKEAQAVQDAIAGRGRVL